MQSIATLGIFSVCFAFVQAVHWQVATGLEGASGPVYSPDSLAVQPGDTIEFVLIGVITISRVILIAQIHDITEAPFTNPCTYLNSGFLSNIVLD